MKRKVVIITDCTDVALLEIRGAIYSNVTNDDFEIEPIVRVNEMNIINTSFLVRLIANIYPEGTIINVVVNPLKLRTQRIVGRLKHKNIIFEGTNTGAFGWTINEFKCDELYEIFDNGFVPFGGKYVHAPVIGKILSGEPLENLGKAFLPSNIRDIERGDGLVVHIDNFGNVKFIGDLTKYHYGDKISINVNGKIYEAIYWKRMMERNDNELIIYPGSSFDLPELGVVRGNAAESLGIKIGDILYHEKIKTYFPEE